MFFDLTQADAPLAPRHVYQLLVGGIVPRPIAWIKTAA